MAVPLTDPKFRRIDEYMAELEPLTQLVNKEKHATYYLGKVLGKGGFSKVFLATEATSNNNFSKTVAVKVIPKKRLQRPDQEEKVEREILIQSAQNHPNIVKLLSSWSDGNMVCIVLEHCETGSLHGYMKKFPNKQIPEREAIKICGEVLPAISYLHDKNIIHRDIKMGNILLTNGIAKIADFGLALVFDEENDQTLCGTPNFLAPEVLRSKKHLPASDFWAFGCVLFCMLAGNSPFMYTNMRSTARKILNGMYILPEHFSEEARDCINKILVQHPVKRLDAKGILETALFRKYALRKRCLKPIPNMENSPETPKKQKSVTLVTPVRSSTKPSSSIERKRTKSSTGQLRRTPSISQLNLTNINGSIKKLSLKDLANPVAEPVHVLKWVDNFHHSGFGYLLSNEDVGVKLKAGKTLLERDGKRFSFKECEICMGERNATDSERRVLDEFKNYMNDRLINGATGTHGNESSNGALFVTEFSRTEQSIVIRLSNDNYQVNILSGPHRGTKVIISNNGILLINRSRQKKFRQWDELLHPASSYHLRSSTRAIGEMTQFLATFDHGLFREILTHCHDRITMLINPFTQPGNGVQQLKQLFLCI